VSTVGLDQIEITTVADDEIVAYEGDLVSRHTDLAPDTDHLVAGITVRTQPRPGELLCRFATVNDVHFGEQVAGVIGGMDIGPTFSVPEDQEPYPELMNRAAVDAIRRIDPAAVVVKGDLTSAGSEEQYRQFLDCYKGFGDRLHHVRGNHESYQGNDIAAFPHQSVVLPGVILAIIDTSRPFRPSGAVSQEQIEWLDDLAADADRPVLVFGHHNIWNPDRDVPNDEYFGIVPDDSMAFIEVVARRPRIRGYFAGHTHRNHREFVQRCGDVPFVEVAAVKEYPGTWAEYRVFDRGIMQVHRRIDTPEALAWTNQTRAMYQGAFEVYAFGALDERNFVIPAEPATHSNE
jgi:predicted phosphodiesterase